MEELTNWGTPNDIYTWDMEYYTHGTHTGGMNVAILTDAAADFVNDGVQNGDIVYNVTDGSQGTITNVTATTITATLVGGAENDWDTGDEYNV